MTTPFDPNEAPSPERVLACAQALNNAAYMGTLRWNEVNTFDQILWQKLARAAYWSYVETEKS